MSLDFTDGFDGIPSYFSLFAAGHDRYGVIAEILTSSPSLAFNLIRTVNKAPQLYVIIVNARGFHVPGNE